MAEITIEVDNQPEWVIGYFRAFSEWHENIAPKPLPNNVDSYIQLFSKYIGIDYDVISNLSADKTKIESLTFKWTSEQDRTFFMLKF